MDHINSKESMPCGHDFKQTEQIVFNVQYKYMCCVSHHKSKASALRSAAPTDVLKHMQCIYLSVLFYTFILFYSEYLEGSSAVLLFFQH